MRAQTFSISITWDSLILQVYFFMYAFQNCKEVMFSIRPNTLFVCCHTEHAQGIHPDAPKKLAMIWNYYENARAGFVRLVWMNEDNLSSWTKHVLGHSFYTYLRGNFYSTSRGICHHTSRDFKQTKVTLSDLEWLQVTQSHPSDPKWSQRNVSSCFFRLNVRPPV